MEYLLTSNEMKVLDYNTIENIGISSSILMEKAALGVIDAIQDYLLKADKIMVVCGGGNNGGDGIAIARILSLQGKYVRIVLVADESKVCRETKRQIEIAQKYNIKIYNTFDKIEYNVIIDAVFGIGLTRNIEGNYKKAIDFINKSKGFKVALDIPSGIATDTGAVMGVAVKADRTVAIAYKKLGHILYPGADYCNEVIVKDIGVYGADKINTAFTYTKEDLIHLPHRLSNSNKGTYGKALIIAGSMNMAGAAFLAALAAYRTGCGLVRIVTREENREILQTLIPEAILTTYEEQQLDINLLEEAVSWSNVIDIGPGLGKSETAKQILEVVLKKRKCPLVIDADGINLLAENDALLSKNMKDIIVTPHLKEMSGICKRGITDIKQNLVHTALEFAQKHKCICVLKDAKTVVANCNKKVYINQSGNNSMAKAGSGDILSGIITGLLAQQMSPFEGAVLGVYLHGMAGDEAAKSLGEYSVLARDIAETISTVIQKAKNRQKENS